MLNHIPKCDCCYCVPPTELLSSPVVNGKWTTKEELIELRKQQEKDAIDDLASLLEDHKAGIRATRDPQPSTRNVVNGMMIRFKRNFVVFNVREINLAILAWRHRLITRTTPSKKLSIFVKLILEIYGTKDAKDAAKRLESKRSEYKAHSENPNTADAEFEKDVATIFHEKATVLKLRDAIDANQQGTFHFEFGCAVFYPTASDAVQEVLEGHVPVQQQQQAQNPTIENAAISPPANVLTQGSKTTETDHSDASHQGPGRVPLRRPTSHAESSDMMAAQTRTQCDRYLVQIGEYVSQMHGHLQRLDSEPELIPGIQKGTLALETVVRTLRSIELLTDIERDNEDPQTPRTSSQQRRAASL